MRVGPGDGDGAAFHGLAQGFQGTALIFRQLIQEQNAQMGQRHLAGSCFVAAADQRGQRGRMVRVAVGPFADQATAVEQTGQAVDHTGFQSFGGVQGRQQARQTGRQHRFTGTGGAHHEQVMATGGGYLQGPLGAFLALDIGQVQVAFNGRRRLRLRRAQHLGALEMVDQGEQIGRRQNRHAACPGGFTALGAGTDQAQSTGIGMDGGGQHAGDRRDGTVQSQFAQGQVSLDAVFGQNPHGG